MHSSRMRMIGAARACTPVFERAMFFGLVQ
jgi:hypothetical protein